MEIWKSIIANRCTLKSFKYTSEYIDNYVEKWFYNMKNNLLSTNNILTAKTSL